MTIKHNKSNMGSFKTYVTCIMILFTPFNQSHFVSSTLPLPLCHSINLTKELWNERKEYFLHILLLQQITLFQRRQKITSLSTIGFRHLRIYEQPTLKKIVKLQYFCANIIYISDTLVGSFLDVLFLLLSVIFVDSLPLPK